MANRTVRPALALVLVGALSASLLPTMASAKRTRPSGSSSTSAGRRASTGSATVTRGSGSGRASGRATYGYHGQGRRHGYGYGYGYGYHHYPNYWYLGYPGLFYWRWGYPWIFDHPIYRVIHHGSDPGAVETDIKPKKAEVHVDGQLVGEARDYNGSWDLLFLEPGLRSIQFRAPGYMTLTLWLDVEPGSYLRIKERLAEGQGSDPRSMARPAQREELEQRTNAEEPAADDRLPQGLLRIEASPADAAIYLDGEFLARADELGRLHGALPVARGRHVIEVVRPGYIAESLEIVVQRDEPQKVRIKLKRKGGAADN